jgi:hypothetical protein
MIRVVCGCAPTLSLKEWLEREAQRDKRTLKCLRLFLRNRAPAVNATNALSSGETATAEALQTPVINRAHRSNHADKKVYGFESDCFQRFMPSEIFEDHAPFCRLCLDRNVSGERPWGPTSTTKYDRRRVRTKIARIFNVNGSRGSRIYYSGRNLDHISGYFPNLDVPRVLRASSSCLLRCLERH